MSLRKPNRKIRKVRLLKSGGQVATSLASPLAVWLRK
jgi:hypothetical protein